MHSTRLVQEGRATQFTRLAKETLVKSRKDEGGKGARTASSSEHQLDREEPIAPQSPPVNPDLLTLLSWTSPSRSNLESSTLFRTRGIAVLHSLANTLRVGDQQIIAHDLDLRLRILAFREVRV